MACLNIHWVSKSPATNQLNFHLEELELLPLKYADSIPTLQRAIKNIFDFATDQVLKVIHDALDRY